MKVLAVSASPRDGDNSDVLRDQFLKGAADAGHKTEKINIDMLETWDFDSYRNKGADLQNVIFYREVLDMKEVMILTGTDSGTGRTSGD